jgi:hypothetical protein
MIDRRKRSRSMGRVALGRCYEADEVVVSDKQVFIDFCRTRSALPQTSFSVRGLFCETCVMKQAVQEEGMMPAGVTIQALENF